MAATILDALLVTLGLDASGFKKGQKEAQDALGKTGQEAEKTRKRLEDEAKKQAQSFDRVRDAVLGLTAAIVGAVAGNAFVDYLNKNDAATGRLARNIGAATEEVSIFEGIWRRMGSSSGEADNMLRGINKIIQDIKLTGTSEGIEPLIRAGLNMSAFIDKSTTATQRVKMLTDALSKISPQDAQYFGGKAGFGEDSISILMNGRKAMEDLIETQKRLNVVSDEDRRAAQERTKAWSGLEQKIESFGRTIATLFTPALVSVFNGLQSFFTWCEDHIPIGTAAIAAFGSALLLVKGYALSLVGASLPGAIGAITTSFAGLVGQIGLLAAALAGGLVIGTGLKWLIDKGIELSTGNKGGLGGWLYDKFDSNNYETGNGTAVKGLGNKASGGAMFASLEQKYGLPSGLLDSMWKQESGRGQNMTSPKGAKGHFQFMDRTAKQYGLSDPNDLGQSAEAAAHYMHDLMGTQGGDLDRALASYNFGPGNVNSGKSLPPETMNYIRSIRGSMASSARGNGGGGSSVNIDQVTINTAATDAAGISRDFKREMNYTLTAQATPGVN